MSKKFEWLSKAILLGLVAGNVAVFSPSALASGTATWNGGSTDVTVDPEFETLTMNADGSGDAAKANVLGALFTVDTLAGNKGEIKLNTNGTFKVKTISNSSLVINNGTLTSANEFIDSSGALTLSGMIISNGINQTAESVTLNNANTVNAELKGAGAYTNNGTLTVADAANLAMTHTDGLKNSGTVNLGGGTLGAKINGGTLNINGSVSADADYIAATTTVTSVLTLTGDGAGADTLTHAISGNGNVAVGSGTVKATIDKFANDGTLTVNSGATLEFTADGTLTKAITGEGTLKINGDISAKAEYIAATTTTVESSKTLTLTQGTLGGKVQGAGTLAISEDVSAAANYIAVENQTTIAISKKLTLTKGTGEGGDVLGGKVNGDGTLVVSDDITADADFIGAATTVVSGKTLTLTEGTLDGTISNSTGYAGNVTVDTGTVKATVGQLNGVGGDLTVNSGATLDFTESGELTKDITDNGTVQFDSNNDYVITAALIGSGTIRNEGTLTVVDATKLAITGGVNNENGTIDLGGTDDTVLGIKVTKGTLNLKGNVTVAADNLDQVTTKISDGKTLTLTKGTGEDADVLGGKVTVADDATLKNGILLISDDIKADASYIAAGTTKIADGKTLTLNVAGKTLGGKVTVVDAGSDIYQTGVLDIAVNTYANASFIAANKNIVSEGKTLTLTGGTLGGEISGDGAVRIYGSDVTANADYFVQKGALTADSTLILTDGVDGKGSVLSKDILGTGTVLLMKDSTIVVAPKVTKIEGTLESNDGTLSMVTSGITTLNVGKLSGVNGITNVELDVDLADLNNISIDTLNVGSFDNDHEPNVNVSKVNVIKDYTGTSVGIDIPYVTSSNTITGTYTTKDGYDLVEYTGYGKYTFSNDTDGNGKIHLKSVEQIKNMFTKFATNDSSIATLDTLALASTLEDSGDNVIITASKTLNLQGYDFKSTKSTGVRTVSIQSGNTFTLIGSATKDAGSIDANTKFVVFAATTSPAAVMNVFGATEINGDINNLGSVTFKSDSFDKDGKITINGKLTGIGSYTNTGTLVVADAGNLGAAINNYEGEIIEDVGVDTYVPGTIQLGGTNESTLVKKITGGNVEVVGAVSTGVANVNDLDKITVSSKGTLTLTSGTLTGGTSSYSKEDKVLENDGTINISVENPNDEYVTMDKKVKLLGTGTLVVEKGMLVFSNTAAGSIENNVTIKAGATMDPNAEVFKAGTTVTDYGTLEINNAGPLAANVLVDGSAAKMVLQAGTIALDGGSITQTNGSIMNVLHNDGSAIVTGVNSIDQLNVSGGTLKVDIPDPAVGDSVKLVEGDAVSQFIKVPALQNTNLWNNILVGNNVDNADNRYFLTEYFVSNDGKSVIAEVRNLKTLVEANTNGLAGVQQGALAMTNQMNDKVADQMSLTTRPAAEKGQKYAKQIWASYINSKEDLSDRELWNLSTDNTAKYKGAIVGVDFFSSEKAIAGVALSYATGDITANTIDSSRVQNDSKYYGISLYDRVTNGPVAFTYDIGYQNGKNEISTFGRANNTVTADVKTNLYTLGARVERAYTAGKNSTWAPFVSLRYTRLNTGDYTNSNGAKFDSNSQNLFIPKLGVAWKGTYGNSKKGCAFSPVVEVGYMFNMGSRNAETKYISATGHAFNTDYDIVDSGSFYGKVGLNLTSKKFTVGVDYRYLKGSTTKNNKWNVNLSWSF